MNISKPVASSLRRVDFGFLSSEETKSLSVKRIQCSTTFDNLLHPVPGGLYDPSLGAWGDSPCATCQLNLFTCPGHPGHIELPVPVYHATFMSQAYRLLRAKCSYCHRFRIGPVEKNLFICKLRLIHHGLSLQADKIDDLQLGSRRHRKTAGGTYLANKEGSDDSSEGSMDEVDLIDRRSAYVDKCLEGRAVTRRSAIWPKQRDEVTMQKRRALIREIMSSLGRSQKCANCGGVSPRYRKDRFVKIFEKPLSTRDFAKMKEQGLALDNAVVVLNKRQRALERRKVESMDVDEGIVADLAAEESDDSGETLSTDDDELIASKTPTRSAARKNPSQPTVQRFVDAGEVRAALTLLFQKEQEILNLIYDSRPCLERRSLVSPEIFFIQCLLVPPSKYRPDSKTSDGEIAEAEQNSLYKSILKHCDTINDIHTDFRSVRPEGDVAQAQARKRTLGDLHESWTRLQEAVNSLLDRDQNPAQGLMGRIVEEGIKQKLERKDGLFRKNIMGKRVNFAARSVISPDPNIETNEVGIPLVFAKKLTYPEPVTNHNYEELKAAILNGMEKWPGAAAIENENGQVISLRTKNVEERQALANQLLAPSSANATGARNKKVHRHLHNGDVVLMNRQPTLHKPSLMAHRARVLPGEKTIRMHYANCNTYNADFDGDEMNLHFPQDEIARAEALQIADTDHQYLVATSGKPLRGLIQDHLSMGVGMTSKDTFFDRHHYYQLLYSCLRPENNHTTSNRISTVTPAIIKPNPMWTGKQVITTVLENIRPLSHSGLTLSSKSSVAADQWFEGSEEGRVLFKDGEFLCGVLDKSQLGPSVGGFVHSVYEIYGHVIAGRLLGIMGRLLTKFLHMRAFSCGVEDLTLTTKGDLARRKMLENARKIGLEVAAKYVKMEGQEVDEENEMLLSRLEDVFRSGDKQAGLDSVMNSSTQLLSSEITKACLPVGLAKPFPRNQMQTMTTSGAKGSIVNANLISCNLGQQILEGRRVPTMISGKTLPCFKPYDTDIRAGGYICDRFLTGIRPQEYYFHSMAGREGLIDTAVKTSRSGYLQRCLVKGMEGIRVEYDNTVRDSDGSLVQFLYGEDGLDVTKQKHLMDFSFVAENFHSQFAQLNVRQEFQHILTDDALKWNKKAMKKVKKTGRIDAMDPVLAHFSPSRYPYSTSETFAQALRDYQRQNPERLLRDRKKGYEGVVSKKDFEALMSLKYLKATIEPGEAVGIVAGQSIGEPSTQMTLNTFHLAGHATKNVTLGIPRLREIVMSASSHISTPVMTLPLHPQVTMTEAERFAKSITRLSLAEIIENVTVKERMGHGRAFADARIFDIRIDFYPTEEYCREHALEVDDVADALELKLAPRLQKGIRNELRKRGGRRVGGGATKTDAVPQVGQSAGPTEMASSRARPDEEGGDEGEDDDDVANSTAKRIDAVMYDEVDEDEDEGEGREDEDERIAKHERRQLSAGVEIRDEGIGSSPEPDNNVDDGSNQFKPEQSTTKNGRANRVMAANRDFTAFEFDDEAGQWCLIRLEYSADSPKILVLNLVESACRSVVIHAIPGLGSCTASSVVTRQDASSNSEGTSAIVMTEGVNLMAMRRADLLDMLDFDRMTTNDIDSMLRHYGVEACRASIILEMGAVFKGHGISVDLRHLNLIADTMTRAGGFRPFSRYGAIQASTSPFLKMSFETTTAFLRDALLDSDHDDLLYPSARLVVGKLGRMGTGAFDVMMPL